MKLSVIIVNYNVRHFLEQCLHSVFKAAAGLETEVFVVDNASVDGSCRMIREKFPETKLIENQKNKGFSVANNQAIRNACGEYILLLNPDTMVDEDCFTQTVQFMDEHPDSGGLGVRMIDGKGKFLPESKRGLPTPLVAFYKIFGLSALFPRSKKFGKYHLTFLDENKVHAVDVLCGAFMMLRRKALDRTGLLDESFFMYGEDIDLSYRILKAGYRNYYYPGSTIIHYKGESTKKNSLNYVRIFYSAMIIFARKHFSSGKAEIFSFFIHLAIWFRALIAVVKRVFFKIYLPLLDALLIYAGFYLILPVWERTMHEPGYYPAIYLTGIVPAYILFWLAGAAITGGYRKPVSLFRLERGLLWGSIALLLTYSLIPEELRFSRVMIILGSLWAMMILPIFRIVLNILKIKGFEIKLEKSGRTAIVGSFPEITRVTAMLNMAIPKPNITGYVSLSDSENEGDYLGPVDRIREIVRINRIEEVIFCSENLRSNEIIKAMLDLADLDIDFKIAPPESLSIIGSNSIHTAGDLYTVDINAISRPGNRRTKRSFDITVSILLLLCIWISIWLVKNKHQFLKNILMVLAGRLSWVGYIPGEENQTSLPAIKKGILHPGSLFGGILLDSKRKKQLNILYAKNYRIWNDMEMVSRNWNRLDSIADE
jgi:O-antigen biosynthesis protein